MISVVNFVVRLILEFFSVDEVIVFVEFRFGWFSV